MAGSAFFWFGMIFTLLFVGQSELIYIFSFDGDWVETGATIEAVSNTFAEVNNQEQYEFTFSYEVGGQSLEGTCYGPFQSSFVEGNTVEIEYRSGNPARSRILGMTTTVFPIWVMFVLIFPLIGFVCMAIGFRQNVRTLSLLRNGKFTQGKKLTAEPTNVQVNNNTVYAYEFEFEANYKKYIANCKTHLRHRVEDEELEKILYNKTNPNQNLVYDAISTLPNIDQFGRMEQAGPLAVLYLGITVLGLLVNGAIYYGVYM